MKPCSLITIVFGLAAAVMAWLLLDARHEARETQLALQRMSDHATELEQRVLALEEEKLALQSQTIDGLIERGGDSVVESWSEMADHFAREMERLGRVLEEQLDNNSQPPADDGPKNPI